MKTRENDRCHSKPKMIPRKERGKKPKKAQDFFVCVRRFYLDLRRTGQTEFTETKFSSLTLYGLEPIKLCVKFFFKGEEDGFKQ